MPAQRSDVLFVAAVAGMYVIAVQVLYIMIVQYAHWYCRSILFIVSSY